MKRIPRDPVELCVFEALESLGVEFTNIEYEINNLDFYIPSMDLYIECCAGWTPRKIEQASRVENIIIIQGREAAKNFKKLLLMEFKNK